MSTMHKILPIDFDSLPESKIDSSDDSDHENGKVNSKYSSANGAAIYSSYSKTRSQEVDSSKSTPGIKVKPTSNVINSRKKTGLDEQHFSGVNKSSTDTDTKQNGGSSDFQEENPLRSHSLFETKDDSSLQKVSTTCYKNEDRVTSGSNDSVSHIESFSTLEAIRLEEDYENDENYVITETDLGEISIGSEQEQQHHQDLVKTSPYASRHYRSLSSPAPFDATELNNQILNQNQLEKESDIRSDERKICKRLFSESCNRRRSYITVASNEPYEELKSPSQVLKLIQRFQQQIDFNQRDASFTEMEDQGSSVGMTKKPPPVYPKFCALKTASELPPESLLSSVVTPPASFREFPQSSLSDLSRDDVASGCEMQLGDPDNSYNIKINHQEEMKYSKCDKEALEVIEQLDKSIDEVILSDHEYAKVIQVETLQQVSDDKNSEECFLKNDHMPTTVTENTTVKTKTVLTNTEVSLTFNLPNNHIQNGVLDPAMADAAVNTDFDVEDNGDLKLEIMNKDIQCILNGTATNLDNSSNIQKIGPVNNLSSHSCSDGNFRVELTSTPISSVSIKKPGEAIKTPKMATVPKSAFLGRLNQEHSIIKKDTKTFNEVPKPQLKRNLGNSEGSHRMSTATLDGAVIAHNPDYLTENIVPLEHPGHFIVVAIDFGTTFSGYAFSFINDPDNIHVMRKWEGGDPGVINQKTLTTVLLTPEGRFHSVGFTARDHYHDLDPEEAKRWRYFDKFKMTLHHKYDLSKDTTVEASNGAIMPAIEIFAHALRYFKDHALQELSDQSATTIINEDVRWIITVPAIWRQPAKQFMRHAAYEAGIASAENPDQLLIALEPEAASIYCRKLRIHQVVSETQQPRQHFVRNGNNVPNSKNEKMAVDELTPGTRYMVVDCGGGTVDITVHEMTDKKGNLRELHKPTGGPCGSVLVDTEFENLLNDIFGADFMEQFKRQRPAGFVDLMMAFEARKRNASPFRNNPSNVSLPFSFVDYFKKCKGCSVENAIKKFGRKDIRWSSQGMLRLEPSAMHQLFSKAIQEIKNHILNVLKATNFKVKYLFLVGGFAESQILQQEIRKQFDSQVKVIIPQEVSLAILKGAVLYGREPTVVSVRRSKMTYGVGVLNRFIPEIHPLAKKIVKDGIEWCTDVFDRFVTADQSVGLGDVVLRSYTPARHGQTTIVLHIYCSERNSVAFITDDNVRRCGTLHLDLSDVQYISIPKRREIQTRMAFGDTEIKISALDVTTGKCVRAILDFLNH